MGAEPPTSRVGLVLRSGGGRRPNHVLSRVAETITTPPARAHGVGRSPCASQVQTGFMAGSSLQHGGGFEGGHVTDGAGEAPVGEADLGGAEVDESTAASRAEKACTGSAMGSAARKAIRLPAATVARPESLAPLAAVPAQADQHQGVGHAAGRGPAGCRAGGRERWRPRYRGRRRTESDRRRPRGYRRRRRGGWVRAAEAVRGGARRAERWPAGRWRWRTVVRRLARTKRMSVAA